MARLQGILANLLCHEAISFLIYGTMFLLLLFYIPYWIRQQLDRQYLKYLAKKAREAHLKQRVELYQASPELDYVASGLVKDEYYDDNDGDVERERKMDMELGPMGDILKDSEDKLSFMSPLSSRIAF